MATMSLDLLQSFVAVAESGSFTAAAARLGVPKSSVSRAIAALEDELDVRLVHRTTRRVSLSTAGAALFERVAPLLAELRASVGDLPESEEQPAGLLRVTAANDFGVMVLADIVARFTARYPQVQVDVRLSNAYVDLVAEGFDVALRISTSRLADSSLTAKQLDSLVMQLYAAPTYLARRGTPRAPADLDDHDWVVFRAPGALKLDGPSGVDTVQTHGRVSADDMSFVHRAARQGAGIALLPTFLAEPDVAIGQLSRVLPRWSARGGMLWIVTPSARNVPRKVSAFRDFVIEAMRERAR